MIKVEKNSLQQFTFNNLHLSNNLQFNNNNDNNNNNNNNYYYDNNNNIIQIY